MWQFIKKSISEKKHQNVHILQDKTACQNSTVLVTPFAKLIPVALISTKFLNQNLSKANDEIFKKKYFGIEH